MDSEWTHWLPGLVSVQDMDHWTTEWTIPAQLFVDLINWEELNELIIQSDWSSFFKITNDFF